MRAGAVSLSRAKVLGLMKALAVLSQMTAAAGGSTWFTAGDVQGTFRFLNLPAVQCHLKTSQ